MEQGLASRQDADATKHFLAVLTVFERVGSGLVRDLRDDFQAPFDALAKHFPGRR